MTTIDEQERPPTYRVPANWKARPLTEEEWKEMMDRFEMIKTYLDECMEIVDLLFPEDEPKARATQPNRYYSMDRGAS